MKLCFVSHSAAFDGAERSLLDLIDGLRQRDVQSLCLLPNAGLLADKLAERGIETRIIGYKNWVGRSRGFRKRMRRCFHNSLALWPLVRAIRRSGCDLVYTNTFATPVGALAAKIARKPHVWHLREFGDEDHGLYFDFGIDFTRRKVGRWSAACIANSHAVAAAYAPHLGSLSPDVVYNAVEVPPVDMEDLVETPWRQPGALRCMMLGRVHPRKGQQDAIRALAELNAADLPTELLLMGSSSGGHSEEIKRMVGDLELGESVHLMPYSERPLPIMNTADVVLVCSRKEAFGRVAVEAMKLGKPVIGTRSGGTPEVVQEGQSGFLYEPGEIGELAACIAKLHGSPESRAAMGAEGLRLAREKFTGERYVSGIEAVLRRVLEDRGKN
ncbi:MAG: glycosyltransferase family 4 protein [Planctomycetota bacterium]|jgi:glycosyltransferase involved in cell wall biosynthesis